MTSKWDFKRRSVDLTKKSKLVIVDFDNTLFNSASPNPEIWTYEACEYIKCDYFSPKGGWWKYPEILAATGRGMEIEKTRAWEGYWNEAMVDIARSAIADPETLAVLLTGRRDVFGDVMTCMLESKGLHFDLMVLNPDPTLVSSTLDFKVEFFNEILEGSTIEEVVIYEDRKPHWHAFKKYFAGTGLKYEVHLVKMEMIYLDQNVEEQLILNLMRRRSVTTSVPGSRSYAKQTELPN